MILNRIIFTISVCLALNNKVLSQKMPDIFELKNHFSEMTKVEPRKFKLAPQENEISLVFNVLFVGYKNFVSSQDMPNKCVFKHSCSEYSNEAIKKFGLIKGGLTAFDRLSRCHAFSRKNYKIDPETNLLIDPLTNEY
jgi:putative component of membrane protein insertase Oxa1/YidC/SpoIIIJ protein YidD